MIRRLRRLTPAGPSLRDVPMRRAHRSNPSIDFEGSNPSPAHENAAAGRGVSDALHLGMAEREG